MKSTSGGGGELLMLSCLTAQATEGWILNYLFLPCVGPAVCSSELLEK